MRHWPDTSIPVESEAFSARLACINLSYMESTIEPRSGSGIFASLTWDLDPPPRRVELIDGISAARAVGCTSQPIRAFRFGGEFGETQRRVRGPGLPVIFFTANYCCCVHHDSSSDLHQADSFRSVVLANFRVRAEGFGL